MPGPACSLLIAALSAAVVEAAAGADGEVAVGRAPVDVDGDEEDSLTFTLVPGAGLRLRSSSTSLLLSYTPRIFYRLPNALGVDRPLVLHQVGLGHTQELSSRLDWSNNVQLSLGELDYTASSIVFDPGVTSVIRSSVAEVVRVEGSSGLDFQLSRRVNLGWDVSAEYTTSLDGAAPLASIDPAPTVDGTVQGPPILGNAVPTSAQLTAESSLSYALDQHSRLATSAEVTYQWFPDTGRYLLLSPDVSWETAINRRTTLGASAGLAYVITLEAARGGNTSDAIGGTGSFQLGSVLYSSGRATLSTGLSASLDWFFDPIAGTSQPRAGVEAGADLTLGRDWLIAPNAAFYTVLSGASTQLGDDEEAPLDMEGSVPGVLAQDVPDATLFRAELPIRYSVSRMLSLRAGGRAALRGQALSADDFRLDEQVELWVFLGLTVHLATSQDDGSWLPL